MNGRGEREKFPVGIIGGTGGIGRWFARFFSEEGYPVLVSGRREGPDLPEMAGKSPSPGNRKMNSGGKNQSKSMTLRWMRIWTRGLWRNVWEWPGYITRVFLLPLQGRRP